MAVAVSVSLFAASPASRESMRRGEELFSAGKWNEARRELAGVVDDPALTAAERQRVECYIALCSIEQGDEQMLCPDVFVFCAGAFLCGVLDYTPQARSDVLRAYRAFVSDSYVIYYILFYSLRKSTLGCEYL